MKEEYKMKEKNLDLIEQFTRIEWLLHRYHQQNHTHFGPMGDPRRGQGRVLAILKLQPEISQKDLSYLLDMRPQSLGELLTKLEKNGYITRTPSETDRRIMNIKLTKEGAETTEQEFSFDMVFECLSEEEQKNLSGYLSHIIESLETKLGNEQQEESIDPHEHHGGNPFDKRFGHYPVDGQSDPRFDMGRMRHGRMPFRHETGMGRGFGERPTPTQDETGEE
jgi:DNA-binding MarR family transcriptional regulator